MKRDNKMHGYAPLAWDSKSALSRDEQEMVEIQRRDLWRHGVRTEPNLTRMAFEFAAVVCALRGKAESGKVGKT